jgi:hypothetical protein
MAMPNEDPQKIKEIRRFSAIYGRFDAKRKPEKPLTLHEVCSSCISFCNIIPMFYIFLHVFCQHSIFFCKTQVSVNEAAAQLCLLMPSLLNRRDELFPLARQVVRNSGYQYSKGHSRSQFCATGFPSKLFGTNVTIKNDQNSTGSKGDTDSAESGKEEGGLEEERNDRRSSESDSHDQRKRARSTSLEQEEFQLLRRKVSSKSSR